MIAVKDITVTFGEKIVLDRFSAEFVKGKVTLVTGASGRGKTTLLRVLAGLQKTAGGEVIGVMPDTVAMAFQEPRLFPWMTVLEQLTIVGADSTRAMELLAVVGLADVAGDYPDTLSGGMRGRVGVLRALAADKPVVLLDEPLSGLDEESAATLVTLIGKECAEKVVIVVTHHPESFSPLAPEHIAM